MPEHTAAALRAVTAAPFFELAGPDGEPLACQWERLALDHDRPIETFEIVTPLRPDLIGSIFGRFLRTSGTFRLEPDSAAKICWPAGWRASLFDILATGNDWHWNRTRQCLTLDPAYAETE